MKKTKIFLAAVSLALLLAVSINLCGCSITVKAKNLMDGVTPQRVTALNDLSRGNENATDFAVRLFKAAATKNENTLISPLSVLLALAMTANGAEGETKAQLESALGMTVEELNIYLYSYVNYLPQGEKYELSLANSLWVTEDTRFTVNKNFLQTNANFYGADVYEAPFDDKQTLRDINNWIKRETDGEITDVLDEIPPEAVMYIVNALAFEAEWNTTYEKDQVKAGYFTKENGEQQSAEMMYSTEGAYLEDERATGFIKYYSGRKYAFAAILPKADISLSDYIASLNGVTMRKLLDEAQYTEVETAMPKFECEYGKEMSGILINMGIKNAFDPDRADFSSLGTSADGNIFVNKVIHNTQIKIGEKGTKAGASTVVEMANKMSMPHATKQVHLNRPFVYAIIDCENNLPVFIGAMTDING